MLEVLLRRRAQAYDGEWLETHETSASQRTTDILELVSYAKLRRQHEVHRHTLTSSLPCP